VLCQELPVSFLRGVFYAREEQLFDIKQLFKRPVFQFFFMAGEFSIIVSYPFGSRRWTIAGSVLPLEEAQGLRYWALSADATASPSKKNRNVMSLPTRLKASRKQHFR